MSGRDPLWADFQEVHLREDAERLADIGDQVLAGADIDSFELGVYERIVVEAYLAGEAG